jgi:hypothetical protein
VEIEDLFGCGGFDFDQEFGSRESRYPKQRTCMPGSSSHEALDDYATVCEEALQIGRVDIQADHIVKAKARRAEHLLEIIDCLIELAAEVAGMDRFALRVNRNLSGAVKDTLGARDFVPLYESESILPFPRVDDFALQSFLPGQTIARVLKFFYRSYSVAASYT